MDQSDTTTQFSATEIKQKLTALNQQHLFTYFDRFSDEDKTKFLQQLLDIERAINLYKRSSCQPSATEEIIDMQPIPPSQFESVDSCDLATKQKYREIGLKAVAEGAVGVLLMAGGQGTRLGVTHPKGMYKVGLPSGKTLFQLQAERILRVQHLAERQTGKTGKITWYIMTSGPTDQETAQFLEAHKYFGLEEKNVVQFKQGLLPCFDFQGKIILEAPNKVAMAPDGNGGIYRALAANGILADMQRRGVKYVHAHSVDNILTKVADPVFIGYCVAKGSDCGAKVVRKSHPHEAVGVVCQINGRFQVVEYSEISEDVANLRDEEGNLVYSAGNICNHFFTRDFLQRIAEQFDMKLKLHVARKKIPYCDENGVTIKPQAVNGIKIEKFVFDVFQFSQRFVTWEVPRQSEFSAMKNSDSVGKDCPLLAKRDLMALHKCYIEAAGGVVAAGQHVEISPLLSYDGEDLEDVCKGRVFTEETVLYAESEMSKQRIVNGCCNGADDGN